jgi:hypothetical protein
MADGSYVEAWHRTEETSPDEIVIRVRRRAVRVESDEHRDALAERNGWTLDPRAVYALVTG